MANKLSKTGITTSATAEAWHVTQSIDALTGVAYDLTLAGTLNLTGSAVTGSFSGDGSQLTGIDSSSYASTASYAVTASYAENGGGGSSLWYDGGTYLSSSKEVQITGSLGISGSIHIVADSHTEFTISGSEANSTFNLTNQNSAGGIVISTAGVGSVWFGTNGNPGDIRIYPGGHLWLTGAAAKQNVSASGDLYGDNLIVGTDITASGNISASGDIIGSSLTTTGHISSSGGTVYGNYGVFPIRLHTPLIRSSTTVVQINDNLDVVGHITASGNISSSGNITAYNISASHAFHVESDDHTEFTTQGSHFNMINQTADKHMFFLTTAGTGTIRFGTDGNNSEVIIGTGGHITASGNLDIGGELIQTGVVETSGGSVPIITGKSVWTIGTDGSGETTSLPDGTAGQRLTIYLNDSTPGGSVDVTPDTSPGNYSSFNFAEEGQSVDLIYDSAIGWIIIGFWPEDIIVP